MKEAEQTVHNQSGGATVTAGQETNVGGDVVGRDKIVYGIKPDTAICPICGKTNEPTETFHCKKCDRSSLCVKHQNKQRHICSECVAEEKRKRRARLQQLPWGKSVAVVMAVVLVIYLSQSRQPSATLTGAAIFAFVLGVIFVLGSTGLMVVHTVVFRRIVSTQVKRTWIVGGVLIIVGILLLSSQGSMQASIAIPASTDVTTIQATPTSSSSFIPFASATDSKSLNAVFGWQPGNSKASSYLLDNDPNLIMIAAGPDTDLWDKIYTAPMLTYPITGNFESQVKITFSPVRDYQVASLGVRASNNYYTWLRAIIGSPGIKVQADKDGTSYTLVEIPYSGTEVYFKIERRNSVFTFSYSSSGNSWVVATKNYVFDMPNEAEIVLITYSALTPAEGITADYSNFSVAPR